MKNRIITIAIVAVVILGITFTLIRNKKAINESNKVADRSNVPVSVAVAKVQLLPVNGNLEVPSVLAPEDEAVISAGVQGKITSLKFDLGTKVTKGEVIGTIDTKQKQIALQTTELTVEKLKNDYERNQDLLKGNAINETAVTDAKYNYENNRLQADQIRQQIADANIVAPISGVITSRKLIEGEFANVGNVIGTVVDVSHLKAQVYVNEKDVYQLKDGDKAVITSDVFPGKTFGGRIGFISPKGDENHNYQVEVIVENADTKLKAGTYIKASFSLGTDANALQIPKKALVDGMKNPYVYVMAGNRAAQRKLVLGREIGENVEVLSGLNAGDEVVTDGQINLIEGSLVEKVNN